MQSDYNNIHVLYVLGFAHVHKDIDGFHGRFYSNVPFQYRYNRAHSRARCVVERVFGVWKQRFRCLDHSGGVLQCTPARCCQIIVATAVLHNMCAAGDPQLLGEVQQVS